MSRLTIEASTPLCLLQDAGRFGVRHLGVTQGGGWIGFDVLGQLAAGQPAGCAGDRNHPRRVHRGGRGGLRAGAGRGRSGAQVDGEALAPWRSFRLHKGQRLQFTQPLLGARAYLAAPGGFDAPKVLGSSARWCAKHSVAWMAWAARWARMTRSVIR
jgi:hypothetical protein